MPVNFDPDVGKPDSPVTKTHIRITRGDDTPADTEKVDITVDTEEAKQTPLGASHYIELQRMCFAQDTDLDTLLDIAAQTDSYLMSTVTCGYSRQLAMAIDPTNSLGVPTFASLPLVGDTHSAETAIVVESLTSFLRSIWIKIKESFQHVMATVQSVVRSLFSDKGHALHQTSVLVEQLTKRTGMTLEDTAVGQFVPFSVWDKYSDDVYRGIDVCRGLNEMTKMVSFFTTRNYSDYLMATVGTYGFSGRNQHLTEKLPLNSEKLLSFVNYHCIRLLHGSKLKPFGVTLQKDKGPVIEARYTDRVLQTRSHTLFQAGWTGPNALKGLEKVRTLCSFSDSLGHGFNRMLDETNANIQRTEGILRTLRTTDTEDTETYQDEKVLMRLKLEGLRVSRAIALQVIAVSMQTWQVWYTHSKRLAQCAVVA